MFSLFFSFYKSTATFIDFFTSAGSPIASSFKEHRPDLFLHFACIYRIDYDSLKDVPRPDPRESVKRTRRGVIRNRVEYSPGLYLDRRRYRVHQIHAHSLDIFPVPTI